MTPTGGGSLRSNWWFLLIVFWDHLEPDINQLLTRIYPNFPKTDGTKTGQKSDLSIQRAVCPDALFRLPSHPSGTKVILCPVTSKRTVDITLISNPQASNHPGSKHSGRNSRVVLTGLFSCSPPKNLKFFEKFSPSFRCPMLPFFDGRHWTFFLPYVCRSFCHRLSSGIGHSLRPILVES